MAQDQITQLQSRSVRPKPPAKVIAVTWNATASRFSQDDSDFASITRLIFIRSQARTKNSRAMSECTVANRLSSD